MLMTPMLMRVQLKRVAHDVRTEQLHTGVLRHDFVVGLVNAVVERVGDALHANSVRQCGPKKRSPLKWIKCDGLSAHQTSVSHAISGRKRAINRRLGNAVTNTRPAWAGPNS
jgi:hypothetical protein